MALDIYSTHTLLLAVEQLTPPTTFLRDRYFPTNEATDIFSSDDVLMEYRDGDRKVAPFVAPSKGGVTMLRHGHYMERYTPPRIAPERVLTIDELKKRGFGEALFTQLTPAQRQLTMILKDISELDAMITRREELMAAETMLTNGCIMRHIADDHTKTDDMEIRFYDGESNPAAYTPSVKWGQEGAKIVDDIHVMIRMLTSRGLPATDLVVAPDVASIMLNDAEILKLLDIRNYNIGAVDPIALPNGVARIMRLNVYGRTIDVFCYDEQYENENGEMTPYIGDGQVILTAPNAGRTLRGAVSQVEQSDGQVYTHVGARVPKYVSDAKGNTRTITLTACPLMVPNQKNPWVSAKVTE